RFFYLSEYFGHLIPVRNSPFPIYGNKSVANTFQNIFFFVDGPQQFNLNVLLSIDILYTSIHLGALTVDKLRFGYQAHPSFVPLRGHNLYLEVERCTFCKRRPKRVLNQITTEAFLKKSGSSIEIQLSINRYFVYLPGYI